MFGGREALSMTHSQAWQQNIVLWGCFSAKGTVQLHYTKKAMNRWDNVQKTLGLKPEAWSSQAAVKKCRGFKEFH